MSTLSPPRHSALVTLLCLALGACTASSRPPRDTADQPAAPQPPANKTIQILSDPPGARIEVNDDYVGDAPCSVQIHCNAGGRFLEDITIQALPVGYGYTQSKHFHGDGPVPSRIFFDMNLRPVWQDINVNVNE